MALECSKWTKKVLAFSDINSDWTTCFDSDSGDFLSKKINGKKISHIGFYTGRNFGLCDALRNDTHSSICCISVNYEESDTSRWSHRYSEESLLSQRKAGIPHTQWRNPRL